MYTSMRLYKNLARISLNLEINLLNLAGYLAQII